ncbi:hypothetical protein [Streptomyces triculaminicus]|uniref:hypothetical protein n=1 Tax=Streptomyces triculaminicus TaxID=2816232 RepID=UPI0037D78C27
MAMAARCFMQRAKISSLVFWAALSVIGTGCSKMNENGHEKAAVMAVGQARGKTKEVSSQIYDMIGVREGKVTPAGPGVSECREDPKRMYSMRHTWSVYDVPMGELSRGFETLKQRLPSHGWKILKDGPNDSPAKTPELIADSTKEQFTANIALIGPGSGKPGIMVTLVSACFRLPEGADLHGEY